MLYAQAITTDAIDEDTHERKLSLNRARNVYKYLISKNISPQRMTYKGCGNKFPLGKGEAFGPKSRISDY